MRMIDADALNKKLCETTIFIKGGEIFQRMINNAPTIEPDGDLISRQDAIAYFFRPYSNEELYSNTDIEKALKALPSAESTGAMDEAIQKYIKDGYMQPIGEDLISRQAAVKEIDSFCGEVWTESEADFARGLGTALSIVESLPSAPDSRQRGEWVRLEREENMYDLHGVPTWGVNYMCDKCGFITTAIQDHFGQYRWCPSCGADMRGGEGE